MFAAFSRASLSKFLSSRRFLHLALLNSFTSRRTRSPASHLRFQDHGLPPFSSMGFPGFHGFFAGLLPFAIFNTALFIQAFTRAFKSILPGVGLRREISTDFSTDSSPFRLPDGSDLGSSLLMLSATEEIRRALPVRVYDPSLHNGHKETKCAVCLFELQSGEEIRGLPHCNHVFHKICLDQCLDYQQNRCPLCRSSLEPEEVAGKLKKREQELAEEMILWFSSVHGAAGLW